MGGFLQAILQGVGKTGSEAAEGRLDAEDRKLKLLQSQLGLQELQQRLKTGAAPQFVGSHADPSGNLFNTTRDPFSGILTDRPGGKEYKPPKAKYADLKQDKEGKWWGLNTETQKMEMVPGQGEYKPAAKVSAQAKVDPIISAQIGKPPDPGKFPQGEEDPQYKLAAKKWGVQAETIKTRMASSAAEARGKAYGEYRPGAFITPEGDTVSAFYGDAIKKGYVPFAPGFQAMSRTVQIGEMQGASSKLRSAINALGPDDAFTSEAVFQLRHAAATDDPKTFALILDNAMAASLNEHQQDYLIWLQQMGERVLSLRNVAGMGQGAQDLRAAIQATLPGISSGTKEFALKRLDAVDNQVNILGSGIPKTHINTQGGKGKGTQDDPIVIP
jgi:hypothetical protein